MQTTAVILIAYTVIVSFLDWTQRLDTITKRWPAARKVLAGRATCALFLLVAISLLLTHSSESTPVAQRVPSTPTSMSGTATTFGTNSPANTGSGNTFNYGQTPKSESSKRIAK
jgi:hypothetical protein